MDNREERELNLEEILKEFSDIDEQPEALSDDTVLLQDLGEEIAKIQQEQPEMKTQTVTSDTVTFLPADTIRLDTPLILREEASVSEEPEQEPAAEPVQEQEAFSSGWEPQYEQPIGEYIPPKPIVFRPRSRLRELKSKLAAGPEKQYYVLAEKGLGKLQVAIFLSLLIVLISAISTAMYALGMVQENRMRLMVFGQFFVMLMSALLGSYQIIEGITDLCNKRFTLNTLLVITFLICCVDGIVCLNQLRVPCCAAFSLQVTMSLWSAYQKRNTQIGQLDTMRRATRLDSIVASDALQDKKTCFIRGEGQVEDFMDTYEVPGKMDAIVSVYAFSVLIASLAVGIVGGILHGVSLGLQVTAVTLLAAVPATMFVAQTRPMAILERRLHACGTVLCGWKGIDALCKKAVFPLTHDDLFPGGSIKMNGVKFYGDRNPDDIVAYATALIAADGSGLSSMFTQLLDSRNGIHYTVENFRSYEAGGIGGEVGGESVLVGSISFLRDMGVDVPQGIRIGQAVCVAVDGEMGGLFALTYDKDYSSSAGLVTLCAYRNLQPVLVTNDFMLTDDFLCSIFGIKPRKILFPEYNERIRLASIEAEADAPALAMTTKDGLASLAYGVTGARAVKMASLLGIVIHMAGGVLGIVMMLILAILGASELLTPDKLFLYELVWMIPGLIITEWTRSI